MTMIRPVLGQTTPQFSGNKASRLRKGIAGMAFAALGLTACGTPGVPSGVEVLQEDVYSMNVKADFDTRYTMDVSRTDQGYFISGNDGSPFTGGTAMNVTLQNDGSYNFDIENSGGVRDASMVLKPDGEGKWVIDGDQSLGFTFNFDAECDTVGCIVTGERQPDLRFGEFDFEFRPTDNGFTMSGGQGSSPIGLTVRITHNGETVQEGDEEVLMAASAYMGMLRIEAGESAKAAAESSND